MTSKKEIITIEAWCNEQLNKNKERVRSIMKAAGLLKEEKPEDDALWKAPHPSMKKPTKRKPK